MFGFVKRVFSLAIEGKKHFDVLFKRYTLHSGKVYFLIMNIFYLIGATAVGIPVKEFQGPKPPHLLDLLLFAADDNNDVDLALSSPGT